MRRRVGEGAPEAKVKRRIRTRLKELGFDEADWEEEARIDFFPGSGGSADFLVSLRNVPVIVIEAEGSERKFDDGFLQARAYAIMLNPERPIPYVMVIAGGQEGLFRADLLPDNRPGVRYISVERLLTKDEILDAIGKPEETLARDIGLLDRFVTLNHRLLQTLQSSRGPKGEKSLIALGDLLVAQTHENSSKLQQVYSNNRVSQKVQREIERLLEPHGSLSRYEGWALAYAFRQMVRPFFRRHRIDEDDYGRTFGRFFTPPEVIQFMVEIVDPKPDEFVLDPVCGSGGFLGRIAYKWSTKGSSANDITQNLIGCDQDETCVKSTKTFLELLLPGSGRQTNLRIYRKDSLTTIKQFDWEEDLSGLLEKDSFDLVIGNPPAGKLSEDFRESVQNYTFASAERLFEVAFLERSIKLIRDNGMVALILPEGIFANAQLRPIREYLVNTTTIEMIVALPRGIFPFTPSKMCIMIIRKQKPKRSHKPFLAKVSDKTKFGDELAKIEQHYKERTKQIG